MLLIKDSQISSYCLVCHQVITAYAQVIGFNNCDFTDDAIQVMIKKPSIKFD